MVVGVQKADFILYKGKKGLPEALQFFFVMYFDGNAFAGFFVKRIQDIFTDDSGCKDAAPIITEFFGICRADDMGIRISMTMNFLLPGGFHDKGGLGEGEGGAGNDGVAAAVINLAAVASNQIHAGEV